MLSAAFTGAERGVFFMWVSEITSRGVVWLSPEDTVECAARLMAEKQVRRLPVLQSGRLCGMLSLGDVAQSRACGMEASRALSEISAPNRAYETGIAR